MVITSFGGINQADLLSCLKRQVTSGLTDNQDKSTGEGAPRRVESGKLFIIETRRLAAGILTS